jgi:hypothetical protein
VALVEREDVARVVAPGEHHVGSVGQADVSGAGVLFYYRPRLGDVERRERLETVHPALDLIEQCKLFVVPVTIQNHVVELGEYEG